MVKKTNGGGKKKGPSTKVDRKKKARSGYKMKKTLTKMPIKKKSTSSTTKKKPKYTHQLMSSGLKAIGDGAKAGAKAGSVKRKKKPAAKHKGGGPKYR
jgi:hypothetical protein